MITEKDIDYGVAITRNAHGVHVSTWSRGTLRNLTVEEARELAFALRVVTTEITHKDVADIVETAAYGGITYWAEDPHQEDFSYDSHPKDTVATIRDRIEDRVFFLTADQVREAVRKVAINHPRLVNDTIQGDLRSAFTSDTIPNKGSGLDCGEIDADVADCVIQVACFGEVTYG